MERDTKFMIGSLNGISIYPKLTYISMQPNQNPIYFVDIKNITVKLICKIKQLNSHLILTHCKTTTKTVWYFQKNIHRGK